MMIEIRNDFHNVAARVRIRRLPARLSPAQIARVRRILQAQAKYPVQD